MNPSEIAQAFSTHAFEKVYPSISDLIEWNNIGGTVYTGKASVVAVCDEALVYFKSITTTIDRMDLHAGENFAVVETVSTYIDGGKSSTVASCDIYDFEDGLISRITSYNIEL